MALSEREVLEQSRTAMAQWEPLWRKNAAENGTYFIQSGTCHKDLLFSGMGRTLLCIANGPSFEKNIDIVKKYRDKVDIICVDKCFIHLMDHGIKPDFVIIADAVVPYNNKYEAETKDITLICNITANPDWPRNWKGRRIFSVNKDNIKSEEIFTKISGCHELIPASSNVGNMQLVFASQIMGYDSYLLLGYDFCWTDSDNYYSFQDSVKRYWMHHLSLMDTFGNFVHTSSNLHFSARWVADFFNAILQTHNIKVTNCSGQGLLRLNNQPLEKMLKRAERRMLTDADRNMFMTAHTEKEIAKDNENLNRMLKEYNLAQVELYHIPQKAVQKWEALCS